MKAMLLFDGVTGPTGKIYSISIFLLRRGNIFFSYLLPPFRRFSMNEMERYHVSFITFMDISYTLFL